MSETRLKCEVTGPKGERLATDMPPPMGGEATAPAHKLRELLEWAEAHSPLGCTLKQAPACSLQIDVP